MMILSQYHIFELDTINIYSAATRSTMKLNRKYRNPYILTHKNAIDLFDRIFILGEKNHLERINTVSKE